jgi:hypothetical protein
MILIFRRLLQDLRTSVANYFQLRAEPQTTHSRGMRQPDSSERMPREVELRYIRLNWSDCKLRGTVQGYCAFGKLAIRITISLGSVVAM